MTPPDQPPQTVDALRVNANQIAGLTLGDLASLANIKVPANFKREKGWSGQLIELWLGASAGSKQEQDFPALGIELKTIPIDTSGKPLETTYVCYAHLIDGVGVTWRQSSVFNKLQRVLWVPIQGDRDIPPAQRIVGTPFFWQLNSEMSDALQQDWEEIMELIATGHVDSVTARIGQYLQLRPKAANGSALTDAFGQDGELIKTRPRGFYLRKEFTQKILQDAF